MTKYRMVKDTRDGWYHIQAWNWYLPFWSKVLFTSGWTKEQSRQRLDDMLKPEAGEILVVSDEFST